MTERKPRIIIEANDIDFVRQSVQVYEICERFMARNGYDSSQSGPFRAIQIPVRQDCIPIQNAVDIDA